MELIDRLRNSLGIFNNDEDPLLEELLARAQTIVLSVRDPFLTNDIDENGEPINDKWWKVFGKDKVLETAIEMYSKIGVEGQTAHSENGITRSYENGMTYQSLRYIPQIAGIYR